MKKLRILLALSGLAALALSCGQKASKGIPAPEAAQYIKAHTGGIVTPQATLRIELVSEIPADRQVSDGLFSFRPDLKGTVIWDTPASVEFVPDQDALVPGSTYEATFHLDKVTDVKEKELRNFVFRFAVQAPEETVSLADVPTGGDFRLADVRDEDDRLVLTFTDTLSRNAALAGMIELEGVNRSYVKLEGRQALVYFDGRSDKMTLRVDRGIKDLRGRALGAVFEQTFDAVKAKPAVEIPLKGNILPDRSRLLLPFRAVALDAVDVSVIRIYENNLLMFLQDNQLNGSDGLRRSGRLVYRSRIPLGGDAARDLQQWNDYSLDLSQLFDREPGALYRIRLSFRKAYSLYGKEAVNRQVSLVPSDGTPSPQEQAEWDEPTAWYWENWMDWDEYDWHDREDPEKPSYYMDSDRFPAVNLMTSDIGLLASATADEKISLVATDLPSACPLGGAQITLYDFQLQKLASGKTDSQGLLTLKPEGKPFVAVAAKGSSKTYLKLIEGSQRSTSRFDVGGKVVADGIKACLYGERGVWRPGDTLFVSMILNDREKIIPDGHPATLELFTPEGQFHSRFVQTGENGVFCFRIPTRPDDPTGFWDAHVKVGGSSFHKSLHLETIKPNRLKIATLFPEGVLHAGQRLPVNVKASWLTGPAAAGLEAKAEMTLRPAKTAFKGLEGYVFAAPMSDFSVSTHTLYKTTLDANGEASVQVDLPAAEQAAGMLNAFVVSSVIEPGGDESFTTETYPYSPFTHYAGIRFPDKPVTGKDLLFRVTSVDEQGRRCAGRTLGYTVFKVKWSWWWENQGAGLSAYIQGNGTQKVAEGELVTPTGADATFTFKAANEDWGRYLVVVYDKESGHVTGDTVLIDWPDWDGRADRSDPEMLSMLTFSLDKESCRSGEMVTAYLPATAGGKALVSVENAHKVVSRHWVSTSADQDTPVQIPVTSDLAPGFFIHVTLLQPYGQLSNDLPLRLYGIRRVRVTDPQSHLEPVLSLPDKLHPQEAFTLQVSEKEGRPMTYTLAIVDEGLLDLTAFKTPDPWTQMNGDEALGVKTWDMYDDVIGSLNGLLAPQAAIGGDQDNLVAARKDNRFNPVVRFIGPVSVAKGQSVKHRITLPMYVGSVRVMVVAAGEDAWGSAWKTAPVTAPLMILPSLPALLRSGDKVTLPVNVFAMEEGAREVNLRIKAEGPVRILDQASQTLRFSQPGDQMARFRLETTGEGTAHLTVTAVSGSRKSTEELVVTVQGNKRETVVVEHHTLPAGGKLTLSGAGQLTLSAYPSFNASSLAQKMLDYPYDCSEQLASKGFALLHLMPLLGKEKAREASTAISDIIARLYARQQTGGGFAYWSNGTVDTWVTSMGGAFLTEAAAKGFPVNADVLSRWKRAQKGFCKAYRVAPGKLFPDMDQAYRLYSLALAGNPDYAAMNRMKENPVHPQARWILASAYALAGNREAAAQLVSTAATTFEAYPSSHPTFGSVLRDKALALEACTLVEDWGTALPLAQEVAEAIDKGSYSTSEAAFAAIALDRLHEKFPTKAIEVQALIDGKTEDWVSAASALTRDLAGPASLTSRVDGPLHMTLVSRRPVPAGMQVPARSEGIGLNVRFTNAKGQTVALGEISQGTEFYAHVSVTNPSALDDRCHLVLSFPLASGWEAVNERLRSGADSAGHLDIRDDRVNWFFDLPKGTKKTFTVKLRAAFEGSYILPSTTCEGMYDPAVAANTASARTAVVR